MKRWEGKFMIYNIFLNLMKVFNNFVYKRIWVTEEGVALEFETKLGDSNLTLDGIDLFKINKEGKITELRVLGRPIKSLNFLREFMMK
mmetsp:Transcript_106449/g.159225  ORF Transcript_106449/g.159225 Transcript_106449/m.159225 type:complete len:88 (+) Transcript_106449:113-376(+)